MATFGLDGLQPWFRSAYAWRWNDATHYTLQPDVLACIRTVPADSAARLHSHALELDAWVQADPTRTIQTGRAAEEDVTLSLQELPVDLDEEVLVSWRDTDAVITRWSVFTQYWGAFCYPSSDDVTVWSAAEEWALSYQHAELFYWRRRRENEPRRPTNRRLSAAADE